MKFAIFRNLNSSFFEGKKKKREKTVNSERILATRIEYSEIIFGQRPALSDYPVLPNCMQI